MPCNIIPFQLFRLHLLRSTLVRLKFHYFKLICTVHLPIPGTQTDDRLIMATAHNVNTAAALNQITAELKKEDIHWPRPFKLSNRVQYDNHTLHTYVYARDQDHFDQLFKKEKDAKKELERRWVFYEPPPIKNPYKQTKDPTVEKRWVYYAKSELSPSHNTSATNNEQQIYETISDDEIRKFINQHEPNL